MASSTPHTIVLKGNPKRFENLSSAAVTPGELLELDTAGKVKPHATAAGAAAPMFAVEDPYNGVTGTAAIDVDYASGETVRWVMAQPGDELYAWLEANGSVNIGGRLESGTGGQLQAYTSGTAVYHDNRIVAEALEAKAGSTVAVRIKVRTI